MQSTSETAAFPSDTVASTLQPQDVPGLDPDLRVETGQASPEQWNSVLQHFDDANLCQTWPYGSIRWGANKIGHVVLKRGDEIVSAAQVIFIKLPLLSRGMAYVKWGPIWQTRAQPARPNDLQQMLVALHRLYVDRAHLLLRVTPWEFENSAPQPLFEAAGYALNMEHEQLRTAVLDLSHSQDQLRASLSRHWRYNLKQAESNALDICAGSTDDLVADFMTLYKDMKKRKGNTDMIPELGYLPKVQRDLPASAKPRIIVCKRDGAPVAALIVSAMGAKAFAVAAATGTAGLELRGSYLLQWRMIEWLKSQNVRWYDLARINEKTHPGTTQFKLGLTGKLGSTVAYLGDFEAYESRLSHLLVGAGDRLRDVLGKARNTIQDRVPHWKEATS